ncbi:succinate dehydrogenase hydrophobic membrane anchor subunit [Ferrovum sp. JA12]|jgi:succinate dehydrogenase / fumarate reductase membrane anchor subunit|uniref:succinate dehydrogenase, hydrophobic membrane anchor protein n=1 Tax=Ferrovum sp. JA12 TaxID=1356299 RepID=UPI000702A391|nr:succinate dehydrogenase, hydrophobic membrane anchor protein [Ferrovum sp. JA12]KRH78759.1 succinate dehydrogenase hydrophobic membrane anchor subunit [Ferrovum sp. JA12]
MVKRVIVGAHYGLKDWIIQRVSAVVMAVYVLAFVAVVFLMDTFGYQEIHQLFTNRLVKVVTLMFVMCLLFHAWIGVRDIFMDYIKPTSLRFALQVSVVVALIGYGAWALLILWS